MISNLGSTNELKEKIPFISDSLIYLYLIELLYEKPSDVTILSYKNIVENYNKNFSNLIKDHVVKISKKYPGTYPILEGIFLTDKKDKELVISKKVPGYV
ncbi:hypothetical protein ACFL5V_11790, partial [Fibrobacterota bacterium]